MSYLNWPVGKIATELPGATSIFFQHRINFCCKSDVLLSQALEEKKLNTDEIDRSFSQLRDQQRQSVQPEDLSNEKLINHILSRFHEVHRKQLKELQRLSARVEKVHADHVLCPKGLSDFLVTLELELEQHMEKEENILFPILSKGPNPMVAGPINVMRSEHDEHLTYIKRIYELTNDVVPHIDACNTWRALYMGLQQFISDFHQHVHLENDVLFERN